MTMPLMPGLMGQGAPAPEGAAGADAGGSISELLAALPPDELSDLVAEADKAKAAGDLEGYLPAEEGAEGAEAKPHAESAETPAEEAAETPAEQSAEEAAGTEQHDAETFVTTIEAVAADLEALQQQLDDAVDAAKEADVDANDAGAKDVEKAIKDATKAVAAAQKDAEKAAKKEDVQAAAAAADEADQAMAAAQSAFDEFSAAVEQAKADAAAEAAPEEKPEASAMKAWASRT